MRTTTSRALGAVLTGLALTFAAGTASADSIMYDLTTTNNANLGPGPYIQVTVNETTGALNTSTAEITFTSLFDGTYLYLMGATAAADINVSGSFTLASFTGSNSRTGFVGVPADLSDGG